MKLPNGYGSVVHLSGNRRKPYMVRKTKGWNEKGYPIYSIIGYAETREEGLALLADFNRNPWDIDKAAMTLRELYELYMEKGTSKLSRSTVQRLGSAYNYMKPIENMAYRNIRAAQMQDIIDSCGKGHGTQSNIKNLFYNLDRYAFGLDIISRQNSSILTIDPAPETTKTPFTDDQVRRIWNLYHSHVEFADIILLYIYTGFRKTELTDIRKDDVDIEQMTIKGGKKTTAGKNRIVPVHSDIQEIVRRLYDSSSEYLLEYHGKQYKPSTLYYQWEQFMKRNMDEMKTPHEARHTFRSKLDSADANKRCIDLLMGHASADVGLRVYTHKTVDELREAIELIKF